MTPTWPLIFFQFFVLIYSIILHEIAHGAMAKSLGDDTAERLGRLSLNPISHIDPLGSIILPLISIISSAFGAPGLIIGWAKPVPFNPSNLKNPRKDEFLISIAGLITNLSLALVFALLLPITKEGTALAIQTIVQINVALFVFNIIPIPPLDGSKILYYFLGTTRRTFPIIKFLESNSLWLLLALIFFGSNLLYFLNNLTLKIIFSLVSLFY
mgnify:CR=1 FL=1